MSNSIQSPLFNLLDSTIFSKSESVKKAIEELATYSSADMRGAIFTRDEVVDFILDMIDYKAEKKIYNECILEPSFGAGNFLKKIINRLLVSWNKFSGNLNLIEKELNNSICAVELHKETFNITRKEVINQLTAKGIPLSSSINLVDNWLIQGDFLLEAQKKQYNYIVGNPPYIRQELIPQPLLTEYKRYYKTMYDRADLYIPFIERSLSLLEENGVLGFICSDRWIKNRYGGPLRNLISQEYHLKIYVDMTNTSSFHSEVSVYPAITIISKERPGPTRIIYRPKIDRIILRQLASDVSMDVLSKTSNVSEITDVTNGTEPWMLRSENLIRLIRRIEKQYPLIENTGCKIGIGVATGADNVFIGKYDSLDVEEDRKIPLITTQDIQTGEIIWHGEGVINPFKDNGKLVNLNDYPKLSEYLEKHKTQLLKRHCTQKNPANWFRTIDRIWPELAKRQKLLIPDIKGNAHTVIEPGILYPHHNLYYIVSDLWNLRILQAILHSNVVKLFVTTYSTKIRGEYLRFQAQYLRRIRIPYWHTINQDMQHRLIQAISEKDMAACNNAVYELYNLDNGEISAIDKDGEI